MTAPLSSVQIVTIASRMAELFGAIAGTHAAANYFEWAAFSVLVEVESDEVALQFVRETQAGTNPNRLITNKLTEAFRLHDPRFVSSPEEVGFGAAAVTADGKPAIVAVLSHVPASPLAEEPNHV